MNSKYNFMRPEYESLPLEKIEAEHRFILRIGAEKAFVKYKEQGGVFNLLHTETSPPLEGKGAGSAVVQKTLEYLRENGKKIITTCPFVRTYIERHPEWNDMLA